MSFLKSFAEGFQTGWKTGATADYYNRRSGGGKDDDPFGDKKLAALDPEFKAKYDEANPGFFGRLFGGDKAIPEISGEDRAAANVRVAERSGNYELIDKATRNHRDFLRIKNVDGYATGGMVEDRGDETQPDPELDRILEESRFAVADSVKAINQDLQAGAVTDPNDPVYAEKIRAFAKSEGRAADDEMAAVEKAVDPDGTLPEGYKAPARMALVRRYYDEKGDPAAATTAVKQMVLYDKFATQALGNIAYDAIRRGDVEAGVKLITKGYNEHDYDGRVMVASLDRGTASDAGPVVNVAIKKDGKVEGEFKATPVQVAQVAKSMASGDEFTRRVMRMAAEADAIRAERKGGGRGRGEAKTIEGATEIADGLIRRVFGAPAEGQPAGEALPQTGPVPPRRGEEPTAEQKIDAAVAEYGALPEAPARPALQPGMSAGLPPVADDAGARTYRPFDVVDRDQVSDAYAEAIPSRPTKGAKLPEFSLDMLQGDERARFEAMPKQARDAVSKSFNARVKEYNTRVDAEFTAATKAYEEKVKAARDGFKPKQLDPDKADELAGGIETALRTRIDRIDADGKAAAAGEFDKIPAGQRDAMRELGVSLAVSNPNMATGSAAANVMALTKINESDPYSAGFRIVRDRRTGMSYAEFPDGRTIRMNAEAVARLAALRAERTKSFMAKKDKANAEGRAEVDREARKAAAFGASKEEVSDGVRNMVQKGRENMQVRTSDGKPINILQVPGRMIDRMLDRGPIPIIPDDTPAQVRPPVSAPQNDPRGRYGSGKRALPVD